MAKCNVIHEWRYVDTPKYFQTEGIPKRSRFVALYQRFRGTGAVGPKNQN